MLAVNAAVLRPDDGQTLPAGPTRISGYAVAGEDRGVARVDVSIDGGNSWRQADLGAEDGPWAWRLWQASVDLPPGRVEIIARAWDTSAGVQPEHAEHVWNPDGYVNNGGAASCGVGRPPRVIRAAGKAPGLPSGRRPARPAPARHRAEPARARAGGLRSRVR